MSVQLMLSKINWAMVPSRTLHDNSESVTSSDPNVLADTPFLSTDTMEIVPTSIVEHVRENINQAEFWADTVYELSYNVSNALADLENVFANKLSEIDGMQADGSEAEKPYFHCTPVLPIYDEPIVSLPLEENSREWLRADDINELIAIESVYIANATVLHMAENHLLESDAFQGIIEDTEILKLDDILAQSLDLNAIPALSATAVNEIVGIRSLPLAEGSKSATNDYIAISEVHSVEMPQVNLEVI
ncbi:hypothetical protein A1D23_11625 [Chelonobacter oris]|uniref:hypothetical protein n=1 Tax=Chelonobacter oris TaxID=505317 RepID=UPI00244B5351|nr:hypothetical protein [Chelonobacter oris]MDH3001101.1 hypothetical protein [Chelonobacter oris]